MPFVDALRQIASYADILLGRADYVTRLFDRFLTSSKSCVPWVPEVSRGSLRDLPAEGWPMSSEGRLTSGAQELPSRNDELVTFHA